MKLLPCTSPNCRVATLPNGDAYTLSRMSGRDLRIKCAACKRVTILSSSEFMRLPDLTMTDLRAMKLEHLVLKDLKGAGLTDEQLGHFEAAGFDLIEAAGMMAPDPRQADPVAEAVDGDAHKEGV